MPQDHFVITRFISEVAARLKNLEDLRPVFAAKRGTYRVTCGWERLPPTAHGVYLASSAVDTLTIPLFLQPSLHLFLNVCNATAPQANCTLTYSGNNTFLTTTFYQAFLQGHIIAIPYPDATSGMYPLFTPP